CTAFDAIDGHGPSVIAPKFRHTERRVDWKLEYRLMLKIYFHHDIRRRISAEVYVSPGSKSLGCLHIEFQIRFYAPWLLLHRRRSKTKHLNTKTDTHHPDQ